MPEWALGLGGRAQPVGPIRQGMGFNARMGFRVFSTCFFIVIVAAILAILVSMPEWALGSFLPALSTAELASSDAKLAVFASKSASYGLLTSFLPPFHYLCLFASISGCAQNREMLAKLCFSPPTYCTWYQLNCHMLHLFRHPLRGSLQVPIPPSMLAKTSQSITYWHITQRWLPFPPKPLLRK